MLFIIEGVDGSGKTTLAEKIHEHISHAEIIHRGPITTHPLKEYTLDYTQDGGTVIADRWHVGEMIYGPLYRGRSQLTYGMSKWIEMFLDSRGALKIGMNTDPSTIHKRLNTRGEEFLQSNHVSYVIDFYRKYFTSQNDWVQVNENYDDEIIYKLIVQAAELSADAYHLPGSYVGSPSAKKAIIVPRTNNGLAGAPYENTKPDIIFRALRTIGFTDYKNIAFVEENDADKINMPLITVTPDNLVDAAMSLEKKL